MKKILTSVIITGLMLYCPLIDSPAFWQDVRLIIPVICSLWLLLEQKELNWSNMKLHAATDGYSTILIVLAGMITQAMPIFEWKWHSQTWLCTAGNSWTYLGALMLFGGLYIRLKAIQELREFFTNEVRLDDKWELIQTGPYKYVRHPTYAGAILTMSGTSVLFESWISLLITFTLLIPVYLYRIRLEEKLMNAHFGEAYLNYIKRTGALFPLIFRRKNKKNKKSDQLPH